MHVINQDGYNSFGQCTAYIPVLPFLLFLFGGGGVGVGKKVKSIAFGGFIAFLEHAPKRSSASKMEGFLHISREIAQIVGGQKSREHAC